MKTLLLITLGLMSLSSCSFRYSGHFTRSKVSSPAKNDRAYRAPTYSVAEQTEKDIITAPGLTETIPTKMLLAETSSKIQNKEKIPVKLRSKQKHKDSIPEPEYYVKSKEMDPHKMVKGGTRLMLIGSAIYALFLYASPYFASAAITVGSYEMGGLIAIALVTPAFALFVCGVILFIVGGAKVLRKAKKAPH